MMKKYIIFDFDGTIINTNDVILASWNETFNHYLGHSFSDSEIAWTFGETLEYTVKQRITQDDWQGVIDYYQEYQRQRCNELVTLFDGIKEMLDSLQSAGYRMAIATSRLKDSFNMYMDKFGLWNYFEVVITKEDVINNKPDPESLNVTLNKLGAKPDEAVMLGDTRFDIGCAANAGVDSILIGWNPLVDLKRLEKEGYIPTHYIKKPEELLQLLNK